jgi:uncharacterized membrane protein YgcG
MFAGVVGALPRANGKLRPYPTGRDPGSSGASVSKNVQAQQRQGNFSCRALPSYFLSLPTHILYLLCFFSRITRDTCTVALLHLIYPRSPQITIHTPSDSIGSPFTPVPTKHTHIMSYSGGYGGGGGGGGYGGGGGRGGDRGYSNGYENSNTGYGSYNNSTSHYASYG